MVYTVTFLKLWSYIHVNYWCRKDRNLKASKNLRRRAFSVNQRKDANVHYIDFQLISLPFNRIY